MNVYLGGTCNGSLWRETLKPLLRVSHYDPVVPNWTAECMAEEVRQREISDYVLYVITPKMTGVFAIAEAVEDSNKRPERTIFCFLESDEGLEFTPHQLKSLTQTAKLIEANGAKWFRSLQEIADFVNGES